VKLLPLSQRRDRNLLTTMHPSGYRPHLVERRFAPIER
jgi:hypothetical protein